MKSRLMIALFLITLGNFAFAQTKYFTRSGHVRFFSSTPMEDIEAHNYKATSVFDATTGDIEFSMLIMAFEFEKALMQEHFNENYMESQKYPKATFKGTVKDIGSLVLTKDGTYSSDIIGKMTIHGVTNDVMVKGTFIVSGGKIKGTSAFVIKPADYKIEIPGLVKDKIAKEIKVTVECAYEPFKKS